MNRLDQHTSNLEKHSVSISTLIKIVVIIQCCIFLFINTSFAEEDSSFTSNLIKNEKNIALVGNFLSNTDGLQVLENIKENDPDLIFFLGDLGYDTPDSWFTFVDKLGKEKISVVIGNHDKDDAKEFLVHYGLDREFYSINYENIHFVILSSDLDYTKDSEQMEFLENDLKEANNNSDIKWKIVLIHKPMIYKDYYVKNDPSLTNGITLAEGLQPVLDAYGVDMIISGHVHLYERSFPLKFNNVLTSYEKTTYVNPEGAIHVIVGTAGADKHHNQYPQTFEDWAVVKNPDVYGFFNLRIPDDKNRLIFEFITNEGYVLDQFQIFETDDSFKTKLNVLSGADLTNADLSGTDLSGKNLSQINLSGSDLSGADLTNADLSGADLTNADLSGADLTNANLSFTNLENIDFSNVKIKDVKLIGVTFTDMDLSGLDLSEKNLAGSSFLRTNLSEANLEKSNLSWANFEQVNLFNTNLKYAELLRANLSEADLSNTELEYSNLMNSNLSKIDFSNVKLTNVKLEKTNLSYSNFSNVDLTGMNLSGTNLYGVHLIGKDLRNTNLKNANFIGYKIDDEKWWDYLGLDRNGGIIDPAGVDKFGEKLYGTDLSGTDLREADLSGVNLSGIDISHANLSDLDLSNTNIERVNLSKTDLSGADLSGKNLSQVNLSGSDLSGADLSNTDFTDMNFFKFQFFGTDLSDADLTNADLSGADLAWGFFYGLDLSDAILECYNHSICK